MILEKKIKLKYKLKDIFYEKKMKNKLKIIKFVIAGILIFLIIFFPYVGKFIQGLIKSFEPHGIILSFTDAYGKSINDARVYVEINAIPPPTLNEYLIRVYLGFTSGTIILDLSNANFSKVVHAWADFFRSQGDEKGYDVGLFVSTWVIDNNDNVIAYKDDTITYNPFEILKGGKIIHTITINIEKTVTRKQQPAEASCGPTFYWEIYQPFSRLKYGKIPLLTVYNDLLDSGTLGTSISVDVSYKSIFGVSIGYGVDIVSKVYSGQTPSISVTIEGSSIEGYFYYYDGHYVGPYRTFWTWMYGEVVHLHEREVKYCTLTGAKSYTGNEKILDYISYINSTDTSTGKKIIGGDEIFTGSPNDIISTYYYNLKGFIKYGPYYLGVYDYRTWRSLIGSSGQMSISLGIALPVGAMIALILGTLGVPEAYLVLIAGLTASMYQYSTTSIEIGGGIKNWGNSVSDGPYSSDNIEEGIYMYATSYNYNDGKIPLILVISY